MPGENQPNRFVSDCVDDASAACLLREEPQRPSGTPFGWRTADHRYHCSLLPTVQLRGWLRSWIFDERVLHATFEVPLAHARNLSWVSADRRCRRTHRLPTVEQ